jgi:hypothetical protein
VQKLRKERVTVGVHHKTVPSIVWVELPYEFVAIGKQVASGSIPIIAANVGQGWLEDARIGRDFIPAARVNICMEKRRGAQRWRWRWRLGERKVALQTLTYAKLAIPAITLQVLNIVTTDHTGIGHGDLDFEVRRRRPVSGARGPETRGSLYVTSSS